MFLLLISVLSFYVHSLSFLSFSVSLLSINTCRGMTYFLLFSPLSLSFSTVKIDNNESEKPRLIYCAVILFSDIGFVTILMKSRNTE